jgi:hypothetical protein
VNWQLDVACWHSEKQKQKSKNSSENISVRMEGKSTKNVKIILPNFSHFQPFMLEKIDKIFFKW